MAQTCVWIDYRELNSGKRLYRKAATFESFRKLYSSIVQADEYAEFHRAKYPENLVIVLPEGRHPKGAR